MKRKSGKGGGKDERPSRPRCLRLLEDDPTQAKGPGEKKSVPITLNKGGLARLRPTFHLQKLLNLFFDMKEDFSEGKCTASQLGTVVDYILVHLRKMRLQEEAEHEALTSERGSFRKDSPGDGKFSELHAKMDEFLETRFEGLTRSLDGLIKVFESYKESLKEES
jgi:hypothetical protein